MQVNIRLTQEEAEVLDSKAKRLKLSKSDILKQSLHETNIHGPVLYGHIRNLSDELEKLEKKYGYNQDIDIIREELMDICHLLN